MVNLSEAFKLTGARDDDIIWLLPVGKTRFSAEAHLGKEIREKMDMKKIEVHKIGIHFSYGESEDWEFTVKYNKED